MTMTSRLLSETTLEALLAALPSATPRVLRARLRYAGTKSAFGGWDVLFDGRRLQLRISAKARRDGGADLSAAYRPRRISTLVTRLLTANAGGWNSLLFGTLPPAAHASDIDSILAAVRMRLHADELAERLLAT
jgi:hypothetical protein